MTGVAPLPISGQAAPHQGRQAQPRADPPLLLTFMTMHGPQPSFGGEGDWETSVLLCTAKAGRTIPMLGCSLAWLNQDTQPLEGLSEVGGRVVWSSPKAHRTRSVPVPRSLMSGLIDLCAGKAPDDPVFTSPKGDPLRLTNWRHRVFDPACRTAGIAPHDLRHTAASLAISAGANVKAVQRMLGHASAAMTLDVYTGLVAEDLDSVAERLDVAAARSRADSLRTADVLTLLKPGRRGLRRALTCANVGGPRRFRTDDLRIKSPLLYQLS